MLIYNTMSLTAIERTTLWRQNNPDKYKVLKYKSSNRAYQWRKVSLEFRKILREL